MRQGHRRADLWSVVIAALILLGMAGSVVALAASAPSPSAPPRTTAAATRGLPLAPTHTSPPAMRFPGRSGMDPLFRGPFAGAQAPSPGVAGPAQGVGQSPTTPNVSVGSGPAGSAYDSANGYVYVANFYSGNVSVLSGTTVVGTVPVTGYPEWISYDDGNGYLYVTSVPGPNNTQAFTEDGNVTILSGTTVVATQQVGFNPIWPTYDSGNGYVYVPNNAGNTVTVFNGILEVATITIGECPWPAAVDPVSGYLYVANSCQNTESVIQGTSVVATITLGSSSYTPIWTAYDSSSAEVYVTGCTVNLTTYLCVSGGSVSILSGTTLLATVPTAGPSPYWEIYDPTNGYVYVDNSALSSISVMSGTSTVATIPVGLNSTWAAAYDSSTGYVYEANAGSNNVSVLNGTSLRATIAVGAGPTWATFDGSNGYVYVSNVLSDNVSLVRVATVEYPVTFAESGLPSNTNWTAALNGTPKYSTNGTITFREPNGTYNYSITPIPGYSTTVTGYSGWVTVNGASVSVPVAFTPVTYTVTFTESGLPTGTSWSVTMNGATGSSTSPAISFAWANGTYAFTVGAVPGYTSTPSSGQIPVAGQAVTDAITFSVSAVTVTSTPTSGPVGTTIDITASGLNASTTYQLVFGPTPGASGWGPGVVFSQCATDASGAFTGASGDAPCSGTVPSFETPGIYYIGVFLGVDTGYVTDASPPFTVTGSHVAYAVSFTEAGLPSGTSWSVALNGTTRGSTTGTIAFTEWNGTYPFTIGAVVGYTARPSSGTLTVNGASASQSVAFSPTRATTYAVTFSESGLPAGTLWAVTLNGVPKSSTGLITFQEANGSYAFTVGSITNFTATPASGALRVSGAPIGQAISFGRNTGGGGGGGGLPPILGLPGVTGYVVVGTGAAVAVIVGVLVAMHSYAATSGATIAGGAASRRAYKRWKRGKGPAQPPGPPPGAPPTMAGPGPPPASPPPSTTGTSPSAVAPGSAPATAPRFCRACGQPYAGAERFCTRCGRAR